MSYRDRRYDVKRGEDDFDEPRHRSSGRRNDRGYGEDYRGYSRGYNMNREPNYRTEQDESYRGRDTRNYENNMREYSPLNRWASTEAGQWEAEQRLLQFRGAEVALALPRHHDAQRNHVPPRHSDHAGRAHHAR